MIIKELPIEELPTIVQYGEAFLRENGMSDFVPSRFLKFWTNVMLHADGVVFAAYEGDEFLGAISAFTHPDPYRLGIMAQEGFWYVKPEYRKTRVAIRLFRAFEKWGREMGASEMRIGCLLGQHYESLSKYFISQGYSHFESEWRRVL